MQPRIHILVPVHKVSNAPSAVSVRHTCTGFELRSKYSLSGHFSLYTFKCFSAEGHSTFSEGLSWAGFPQKNRDGDVCKGVFGASKIILVSSLKEYGQSQNNLSGSNKIRQHRSLLVGSPKKRGDNLGFAYGHLSLWALGGVSHVGTCGWVALTFESSSPFLKSNIRPGSAKQFDLVGKNHASR